MSESSINSAIQKAVERLERSAQLERDMESLAARNVKTMRSFERPSKDNHF